MSSLPSANEMEQQNEMVRQCLDIAMQLAETVQMECTTLLARATLILKQEKLGLESAKAALMTILIRTR